MLGLPIEEDTGSNDQRLFLFYLHHGSSITDPSRGVTVTVFIRLGAGLDLGTGVTRLSISLWEGATTADLMESLRTRFPNASRLENAVLVSQGEHVSRSALLSDGQEIALLLPISGGCA